MILINRHNSTLYASFLTALLVVFGLFLSNSKTLERLDLVFYDALLPFQNNTLSKQIVIVAIDEISIESLGRWPWPRRNHAQLLDHLTRMGARAIGIDILFSEQQKNDPQSDVLFARALARNGKAVLPVAPMQLTPDDPISELLPLPEFALAAKAIGHVDVELDIDGLCRQFFLYAGLGDAHWPAFALAMLQVGGDAIEGERKTSLPTGLGWLRQKSMMIPYAKKGLRPTLLSYVDVYSGRVSDSDIRDKYVLVGATATGLGDVISTPASRSHERMPGVELNANILNGLLQNIHIYTLSGAYQNILTSSLIILSGIIILIVPRRFGFIAMLITLGAILTLSIIFLKLGNIWFSPVVTLLMTVLFLPFWSLWQQVIESRLRQKLLERLEHQMQHHIATDLPNHYMLEDRLRLLNDLNPLSSGITALMVLHVNWPGSASVVLGRPMGDNILKAIGERLHNMMAGEAFIAHLNGDDFAILLTELEGEKQAEDAAFDLLDKLQQPLTENKQQILLAPQVGMSTCSCDGNMDHLLRNAYAAMFKSRIDNAEHLCIYSSDMGQQLQVRSQLEQALIHALELNEFEVYYQPQICAIDGHIVGVEALLRWYNPVLGWVSPESFIPVVEHVGLIKKIGLWVLKTACQQLQDWHNSGLGPRRLAVNVSPSQFADPELHTNVHAIIEQTGISPHELELEITESSLMFDLDSAVKVMRQIKEEGIELAIDDFGTGYSSLTHLRHFPLDRLKIDQSFTREIGKNNNVTEITLTILAMARHLDLKVIAEGVENLEQADFLRSNGCDEFQGFLFSKPLSVEKMTRLLKTGINMNVV